MRAILLHSDKTKHGLSAWGCPPSLDLLCRWFAKQRKIKTLPVINVRLFHVICPVTISAFSPKWLFFIAMQHHIVITEDTEWESEFQLHLAACRQYHLWFLVPSAPHVLLGSAVPGPECAALWPPRLDSLGAHLGLSDSPAGLPPVPGGNAGGWCQSWSYRPAVSARPPAPASSPWGYHHCVSGSGFLTSTLPSVWWPDECRPSMHCQISTCAGNSGHTSRPTSLLGTWWISFDMYRKTLPEITNKIVVEKWSISEKRKGSYDLGPGVKSNYLQSNS